MAERLLCIAQLAETGATVPVERGLAASRFDEIVRQNQRRIHRLLLTLVRDPDAADNLTQECFLRAYQKRATFRGEASISTWLTRIAINLARDYGRSPRNGFWKKLSSQAAAEAEGVAPEIPDRRVSPEQTVLAREAVGKVFAELRHLPATQREAFVLRFVEEMPLEEIAQVMQRDVGTVKTHLFRAVQRVRRVLKEMGR